MSLYGTEWRDRGYGLRDSDEYIFLLLIRFYFKTFTQFIAEKGRSYGQTRAVLSGPSVPVRTETLATAMNLTSTAERAATAAGLTAPQEKAGT